MRHIQTTHIVYVPTPQRHALHYTNTQSHFALFTSTADVPPDMQMLLY